MSPGRDDEFAALDLSRRLKQADHLFGKHCSRLNGRS